MTRKPPDRITAAEFMEDLLKDPGYQTHLEDAEQLTQLNRENYRREAMPVLSDLKEAGFDVESVGQLIQDRRQYRAAIPVLLKWLPHIDDRYVKEDIIRALSVPWAAPDAIKPLVEEFRRLGHSDSSGIAWVIGNALEVIADDSVFNDLVQLATDRTYGESRQMLVAALGNMTTPKARAVLIDLLGDEEVVGFALMGLGKLRAPETAPRVRPFLQHPQALVRKQARKALRRIDGAR